jgi:hypothetical protein
MRIPKARRGFSLVESYIWKDGEEIAVEIPALDWWPPFPGIVTNEEGRRFIVNAPEYEDCSEPDEERLESGDVVPIRVWRKRKWYSRSRRVSPSISEPPEAASSERPRLYSPTEIAPTS